MENVYLIYKNNRGSYTIELKSGSHTIALAMVPSKFKAIRTAKKLKATSLVKAVVLNDKDDPSKSYASYSLGFRSTNYNSNKSAHKNIDRFLLVYQHARVFVAIN